MSERRSIYPINPGTVGHRHSQPPNGGLAMPPDRSTPTVDPAPAREPTPSEKAALFRAMSPQAQSAAWGVLRAKVEEREAAERREVVAI